MVDISTLLLALRLSRPRHALFTSACPAGVSTSSNWRVRSFTHTLCSCLHMQAHRAGSVPESVAGLWHGMQ
jgi:hypothetical protein